MTKEERRVYMKAYSQTPERKAYMEAYYQTPEYKAKQKVRNQTPERKANRKAHHQTPEWKAKWKAYRQTPEQKASVKAHHQTPEWKAKWKAYRQTPERKAKRKDYNKTPERHLVINMRGRVSVALKGTRKSAHTIELVGCSIDQLKEHLESQFLEKMSWNNYGKWHIDHIRPCSSFDLTVPEQQKACFNWSNLQPLWAIDNLKKRATF